VQGPALHSTIPVQRVTFGRSVVSAQMMKTMICAKDLELVALREIRSFPGGEHAAHVEVAPLSEDCRYR
jgi:hypothetical protein